MSTDIRSDYVGMIEVLRRTRLGQLANITLLQLHSYQKHTVHLRDMWLMEPLENDSPWTVDPAPTTNEPKKVAVYDGLGQGIAAMDSKVVGTGAGTELDLENSKRYVEWRANKWYKIGAFGRRPTVSAAPLFVHPPHRAY